MRTPAARWLVVCVLCLSATAFAAGPANPGVKKIPPAGVTLPDADRTELQSAVSDLGKQIESLRASLAQSPALLALLPDVQIYYNAVRYALTFDEFFDTKQVAAARVLLKEGAARAKSLASGQAPWTKSSGLIVKGYVSKIDGSVQPYGLVVPSGFEADPARPRRLDLWYHGRGETLNEISFLTGREHSPGEFTPADTIVLHLYGRYCNANRFAGEVDTFEAMDSVRKQYAIDENRIIVRGFSMGGAACWMFATHHAGLWAAAAPGAGFTETAHFLHIDDVNAVPWYQRKLWHMYDSVDYALNLFNCPTVAYSGADDAQKQAADEMEKAMSAVGLRLEHVIGPHTKHAYEPAAKLEVARRIDALAAKGRDPLPAHVRLETWTLKYNRMRWLQVDGIEHHWQRATIDATCENPRSFNITTSGVTAFTLTRTDPGEAAGKVAITIDKQTLAVERPSTPDPWVVHFRRNGSSWEVADALDDGTLRKRHDLQGPIDDAFMESFVMVEPTGKALNEQTGRWVSSEMAHAISQWRSVFRGEARVKEDSQISDADIASSNLVLWGDPSSNAVLKRIAGKLPIRWTESGIGVGGRDFPAASHVAVMIYPNPLNPKRYVVLNSGHTFREADLVNNARQTAKLPDWAIVDTSVAPSGSAPGGIADAGFFGEAWELTPGEAAPNPPPGR